MLDVTAVVLSVGEESTARAIASVERQTVTVAETITVRGVSPFYHAFNTGATQVRTPFFIQVDADMIIDDTCVEDLRRPFTDRVGVVVGHLRDPLMGRIRGVKLFRTEACRRVPLRDTPSPETDFNDHIFEHGWTNVYALKVTDAPSTEWHIFGEHRPDYTPAYVFSKYAREAVKSRYRHAVQRGPLRLSESGGPLADIAVIAYAHGLFLEAEGDVQAPGVHDEAYERVTQFLGDPTEGDANAELDAGLVQKDPEQTFKRALALGIRLRQASAHTTFRSTLTQLRQHADLPSWIAMLGLCHGLFVDEYRDVTADAAFAVLRSLLPARAIPPSARCLT